MPKTPVAILGLGIMGGGMASRLLAAQFALSVYNRNPARARPFADAGAFVAGSPAEAAARSEIILSMVADDDASRSVWLGEDGALRKLPPGRLLIECSTLSGGWIRELAAAASQRGCDFLDAPVTGSKAQAASGELRFLVGGPEHTLQRARPVLQAMGREIIHFGATGSGVLMKLINNFLCGVQAASLAEAMALVSAGGLERAKALDILTTGAPGSPMVKSLSSRAEARDFTPNFELRLMAKDLRYSNAESERIRNTGLQTVPGAIQIFEQATAAGFGEKDISAVIEFLANARARRTGTE